MCSWNIRRAHGIREWHGWDCRSVCDGAVNGVDGVNDGSESVQYGGGAGRVEPSAVEMHGRTRERIAACGMNGTCPYLQVLRTEVSLGVRASFFNQPRALSVEMCTELLDTQLRLGEALRHVKGDRQFGFLNGQFQFQDLTKTAFLGAVCRWK